MSSKISETSQTLAQRTLNPDMKEQSAGMSYADIPGLIDPGLDVLNQMNANLKMLTELHQRLQFTVREIKSVIRS